MRLSHAAGPYGSSRNGRFIDIATVVAATPKDAHLYCCGPAAMMKAFELATASWPQEQVHAEYFASTIAPDNSGGFIVQLARSGHEFMVPPGKTILAVLKENGVPAPYSCEEGICGTCEMRVVSGIPEHRDHVLNDTEKA